MKTLAAKNIASFIPHYPMNEYLLVLSPHEELRNKIKKIKQEFYNKYEAPSALGGKPYVALVKFMQRSMVEERIISRLKPVAMGYPPIKVELKDYAAFPTHTIFINVTTKMPIKNLVSEIRSSAQLLMKPDKDNKPYFIDDPHITIARKLLPWQFEKGWLEFSHREFTGRFIADCMLLLKRPEGEKAYQILHRFEFQNLPVSTKQGVLF